MIFINVIALTTKTGTSHHPKITGYLEWQAWGE
jgi:hypothetical protein